MAPQIYSINVNCTAGSMQMLNNINFMSSTMKLLKPGDVFTSIYNRTAFPRQNIYPRILAGNLFFPSIEKVVCLLEIKYN